MTERNDLGRFFCHHKARGFGERQNIALWIRALNDGIESRQTQANAPLRDRATKCDGFATNVDHFEAAFSLPWLRRWSCRHKGLPGVSGMHL